MPTRSLHRLFTRRGARNTRRYLAIETLEGKRLMSVGAQFAVDMGNHALKFSAANASSTNGSSVVTWVEESVNNNNQLSAAHVVVQQYAASGVKTGPEISVAAKAGIDEKDPSVAMDAQGDFVVSWTEAEGNGDTDVLAQKFHASGLPTGGLVPVGAAGSRSPSPPWR